MKRLTWPSMRSASTGGGGGGGGCGALAHQSGNEKSALMRRRGPDPRYAQAWYSTHSTNRGYARGSCYDMSTIPRRGLAYLLWSLEVQRRTASYRSVPASSRERKAASCSVVSWPGGAILTASSRVMVWRHSSGGRTRPSEPIW